MQVKKLKRTPGRLKILELYFRYLIMSFPRNIHQRLLQAHQVTER